MTTDLAEAAEATAEDVKDLTPDARVRRGARGVPVVLAGGAEWLIPYAVAARAMDEYRDELYDSMALSSQVETLDVKAAALTLIRVNYELTCEEAAALITGEGADVEGLVDAVVESLIGPEEGKTRRSYTMWVQAALLSNGLDPAKIPPDMVGEVLAMLVKTGRALPAEKFVDTALYQAKRAAVLAEAEW